jgi:hypothetical protein
MTYQAELKRKIAEVSNQLIAIDNQKIQLENELNRLKIAEFEEDLQEEGKQSLLKG